MDTKQAVASVVAGGPAWAYGCESCRYGLVNAPDVTGAVPIYEERTMHAADGLITFCNCQAGHMYRQHLRRWYSRMTDEYREYLRGVMAAHVTTPTMRYEGTQKQRETVSA